MVVLSFVLPIFDGVIIVVDTGYAGIHHSKFWRPIHYDTIEDGQNKNPHLLFSKSRALTLPKQCVMFQDYDLGAKIHKSIVSQPQVR